MQYTPRRLRLEKEQRKKTLTHKVTKLLIYAILIMTVWLIIGQAQKLVLGRLAKTVQVEYGELEQKFQISPIIARHEWVYTSPVSGRLEMVVREGQRVPEGALIAKVIGEGSTEEREKPFYKIYAAQAGVVCYHVDNLENVITPATLPDLDENSLRENLKKVSTGQVKEGIVTSGMPIVKVVNNLKTLFLDFRIPKNVYQETPQAGEDVVLKTPDGSKKWQAKINKVTIAGEELRILAETRDYPAELLHQRLVDLELIQHNYKGIIIPKSTVVSKGEEYGVYKAFTGNFRFEPIEIAGQVGEELAVSGLEPGDEILVNPFIMGK